MTWWHQPPPPVDFTDERSVCAWIEHVRGSAFLGGARGDEISKAEAKALVSAIAGEAQRGETVQQGSTGTASTRAEGNAQPQPGGS